MPTIPNAIRGRAAASGSSVAVAVAVDEAVAEARADVTRLEASATSLGSGLSFTSAQILLARSLAVAMSSDSHVELPTRTQMPTFVMNCWVLHRHSKSVVEQPAPDAAESKQPMAQVGSCATRSGRESDVEFVDWAVAAAAKSESATVVNCMVA